MKIDAAVIYRLGTNLCLDQIDRILLD
jgi:hypothetical protein